MSKTFAIKNANGDVINRIIATDQFVSTNFEHYEVESVDAVAPIEEVNNFISVGELYDRFGALKYPILASTDPMVQAFIKDVSVRQYLDLNGPQLSTGLQMLVDAGFAIDVNAVLS